MKFTVQNNTRDNIGVLMRKLGYHFMGKDDKTNEMSFIRALGQDFYPRFHLFIKESDTDSQTKTNQGAHVFFNLHLDQKRPRYKGAPAHNADYEGDVVEKEAERIKQVFN